MGGPARHLAQRLFDWRVGRHHAFCVAPGSKFRREWEGGVDLNATALCDSLSAAELERYWKVRRRQTALTVYATFALGCLFLLAWVYEASSLPWIAPRLVLALKILPFCAMFFLLAFYHALLNFQIRIGHLASWREYLLSSEPFWPR